LFAVMASTFGSAVLPLEVPRKIALKFTKSVVELYGSMEYCLPDKSVDPTPEELEITAKQKVLDTNARDDRVRNRRTVLWHPFLEGLSQEGR